MKADNQKLPKTRSMSDLRDILFDELDLLRAGKISPARARTTAAIAFQIIDSARVEILYRASVLKELPALEGQSSA